MIVVVVEEGEVDVDVASEEGVDFGAEVADGVAFVVVVGEEEADTVVVEDGEDTIRTIKGEEAGMHIVLGLFGCKCRVESVVFCPEKT
jgi:hypothetical protein